MWNIARALTVGGGMLIINSCMLIVRYRMLRKSTSEQDRSTGEAYRSVMGPMFWLGLFLGILGLVLYLLSLV
jgi:hypothetical protein